MNELDAADFAVFFRALWGREPFAWQRELARRVLESRIWPEAIALPTAAGKTACMDIAVYALAVNGVASFPLGEGEGKEGASAEFQPPPPRRIFFVVDRRVIVDEAFDRARLLAGKLRDAPGGILKQVADRLRALSGGPLPLAAHQLRGGVMHSDAWARSPVQPMIVASTVDQIGSRLLFRAYGPGRGSRPIHAGLAGNDSLILLDEAHCAQPFLETLQGLARYRRWAEAPLPTGFHVTVMSATPPAGLSDVFRDGSDEPRDPGHPLGQRQLAEKPARLVVAEKAKGKKPEVVLEALAKCLAVEAREQVKRWPAELSAPAVVVFCNRVDTARRVHDLLGENAILLTGRMRPLDKDDRVQADLDALSVDQARERRLDTLRFVVATQTLEVGANLDFDLLVTECASLDALRQRFGRLNRLGRPIPARAAIVARADVSDQDDPVYGPAIGHTWAWLQERAGDAGQVDFGIAALEPLLPQGEILVQLNAPAPHAPVLLPAHVDTLAQTAPEPWPSPEVALFLHGPKGGPADVAVCWRADLVGDEANWPDALRLCPPTAPECLAVPFFQMRRWLAGETVSAGADVEGEIAEETDAGDRPRRRVMRWGGRKDLAILETAAELRPGDVLVIPSNLGGWEELATLGRQPVADWGDRARALMRGRVRLRLHPELLAGWPEAESGAALIELVQGDRLDQDPEGLAKDLHEVLSAYARIPLPPQWAWLREVLYALPGPATLPRHLAPNPTGGILLTLHLPVQELDPAFSDEDDESSSGHFRALLPDHLDGVADYAARHGRLCGLSETLVAVLHEAGRGHDLGKADPRFQSWLNGGSPWIAGPLLAKSEGVRQRREESRKARIRAGYPEGGRHELLSVRLLESAPEAMPTDPDLRDLLLHLVESHHGHCRPFAPVVVDDAQQEVHLDHAGTSYRFRGASGLERLDAGPAERYWRLTRRYGWWGLAWLETLLRLADHRRSAWEERNGGGT